MNCNSCSCTACLSDRVKIVSLYVILCSFNIKIWFDNVTVLYKRLPKGTETHKRIETHVENRYPINVSFNSKPLKA